jgi:Protein of unknown function (DUF3300)
MGQKMALNLNLEGRAQTCARQSQIGGYRQNDRSSQLRREGWMGSWVTRWLLLTFLALVPSFAAMAQNPAPPAQNPAAAAAAPEENLLKPEELDALVAPIALYPDNLLAIVLMASTYPLEVVQAERWVSANQKLKGDQLKAAVDKQQWDDSIKSLVATPSVLAMMSSKLDWTEKLGDAVLAQQPDVMDAVQRLRSKAVANNKLTSTKQQNVTVRKEQEKQVVVIEPSSPDTLYVPYYDPSVVYGSWPYPSYPPYYFPQPGYIAAGIIGTGIAFGTAYALGRWASGGSYWGGGVGWAGGNIYANRPVNINNIGNNWQHRAEHRRGVRYNNPRVQQRFGNNGLRGGAQGRLDYRGRGGQQVLNPGGARPGGGAARPGGAGRPGGVGRPGGAGRPGGVGRPGGAGRPGVGRPGGAGRPGVGRPGGAGRPGGGNAFGNIQSGRVAHRQSARGRASFGPGGFGGGFGGPRGGFGGGHGGFGGRGGFGGGGRSFGGGGFGGGRGGGGRGGGRRSDMRLKHDIVLLGHLDNGLGYYRFVYNGGRTSYVGVMAQEVQTVMPKAVVRDRDGYLEVLYDRLGVKFETYDHWIASGARIPTVHWNPD